MPVVPSVRRLLLVLLAFVGVPVAAQTPNAVVFRNDRSVAITVEIRLDTGKGCEAAKPFVTETVQPGKRRSLQTRETICWRRETPRGARPGGRTEWHRHETVAAAEEVTL